MARGTSDSALTPQDIDYECVAEAETLHIFTRWALQRVGTEKMRQGSKHHWALVVTKHGAITALLYKNDLNKFLRRHEESLKSEDVTKTI